MGLPRPPPGRLILVASLLASGPPDAALCASPPERGTVGLAVGIRRARKAGREVPERVKERSGLQRRLRRNEVFELGPRH